MNTTTEGLGYIALLIFSILFEIQLFGVWVMLTFTSGRISASPDTLVLLRP